MRSSTSPSECSSEPSEQPADHARQPRAARQQPRQQLVLEQRELLRVAEHRRRARSRPSGGSGARASPSRAQRAGERARRRRPARARQARATCSSTCSRRKLVERQSAARAPAPRSSEDMADRLEQLDGRERLGHVVVGAGRERRVAIATLARAVTITIVAPAVARVGAQRAAERRAPLSPGIIQSSSTRSGGVAARASSAAVAVRRPRRSRARRRRSTAASAPAGSRRPRRSARAAPRAPRTRRAPPAVVTALTAGPRWLEPSAI